MMAVVGEASLPFRKDEKGRIGEVVPSSCKRFKLFSICLSALGAKLCLTTKVSQW
jgi:hypothetical protein